MRPHPLLALCTATTTFALATTGALNQSAFASRPSRKHDHPHTVHLELRKHSSRPVPETRLSGVMPLTFAITGGPALGGYVPPAVRRAELAAHRRARAVERAKVLEERRAKAHRELERAKVLEVRRAKARHEARLLALRRRHRAEVAARRDYTPAGGVWAELRQCESGSNYHEASGNGYYGAYQFLPSTWWALGFSGLPSQAPPAVQDRAARMLLARQGWGAWPGCSAALGL